MAWYFSAGMALLGGIMEGRGYRQQAAMQEYAYKYNEMIEKRNAEQEEVGEQWAGIIGGIQKENFREQFHELQGAVRASLAGAGVSDTGTAKLILLDNAREADENIAAIQTGTSQQMLAHLERKNQALIRAQTQSMHGRIARQTGKQKQRSAMFGALLGVGGAYGKSKGWLN